MRPVTPLQPINFNLYSLWIQAKMTTLQGCGKSNVVLTAQLEVKDKYMPEKDGDGLLVTFKPIIDSGMDLVSRLESQQEAFDNNDTNLNSIPLPKRVTITELDAWYGNCYRIVEDTFGRDSEENKILKSGIAAVDAQHRVKVRTDSAMMHAERLVAIIAILQQFEARLLSEAKKSSKQPGESEPDPLIRQIFRDLLDKSLDKPTNTTNISFGGSNTGVINTGNAGDIHVGDNNLIYNNIYSNALKEIKEAENVPEEQKSKAEQVLTYVKDYAPTFLPIVADGVRKFLGLA